MKSAKSPAPKRSNKKAGTRKLKSLTRELSREDVRLAMPLLDAAVAGVVLGFRPSDREMRRQAERCWETLKPQLSQHLLSEDQTLLPWAEGLRGFPPRVVDRIKRSHHELRELAKKLADVSFEEDSDEIVARAGKALCMLSVKLDDLIDTEEASLFPTIRKLLFA